MDSLKSLLDQKKYELVLKLTETSNEATDLFYRISAFICLGKYEDALFVVQDHQKTLQEKNMPSLIKIHIELLCALERYDQADTVLDYYSNLPYESQIVEEVLRSMPDVIENSIKASQPSSKFNEEEIFEKLTSKNNNEVLFGLDLVKKMDIFTYLPEIANIIEKNENQTLRSIALMLLVQKEVDRELKFLSYKGMMIINPKKLPAPFTGETFNSLVRRMDSEFKNSTLSQNAAQILSTYSIYTYPHEITCDEDELLGAIYLYSLYLLKDNSITIEEYAQEKNLDLEKIKTYFEAIDLANNDF